MVDKKISEYAAYAAVAGGDLLEVVPAAGGNNRKITITNLFKAIPVPIELVAGAVDNLSLDFVTTPTRQVNPLKIRVLVEGNMTLGGALPDGGTVTGNVNIIDIEALVEAGGLVSGAKFTGISVGIDGHVDDHATARIYGIEFSNSGIATPVPRKAIRLISDWHTGLVIDAGTYIYGIDLDNGTMSTDIRLSGGSKIRSPSAGVVEFEYTAGTNELRLDGGGKLVQHTFHDGNTMLGRFFANPDNQDFYFQNEMAGGDIRFDPGSDGYVSIESIKTTTGDPANGSGRSYLYVNTVDNVIKMYADGGWRTLVSW